MSSDVPPDDLAFHFRHFIRGLCDMVANHIERDAGAAPLIVAIINRLCRRENRFMALLARFRAGTLRRPRPDGATRARGGHAAGAPDPVPRCRAYLVRLLKHEAAVYGRILHILLAEPETMALIAASPQAGRLLRPLWRMLSPRPYPPVLRPRPRDVVSSPAEAAGACPAPPPALPCASPGAGVLLQPFDPVRAILRSGFDPPVSA